MSGDVVRFGQCAVTIGQYFRRWCCGAVRCAAEWWVTLYFSWLLFGWEAGVLIVECIEARWTDAFDVTWKCTFLHVHVDKDIRASQKDQEEEGQEYGQVANTSFLDDFCNEWILYINLESIFVFSYDFCWFCIAIDLPLEIWGKQSRVSRSSPWHCRVSGSVVMHLRYRTFSPSSLHGVQSLHELHPKNATLNNTKKIG